MQTHADSLHGRVALVLVLQRHSFMRSCIRALLNKMSCAPVCSRSDARVWCPT